MQPFAVLVKPVGPDCNLACSYCFYSKKHSMFGEGPHRMSYTILGSLIRSYMAAGMRASSLTWQGGEPMLMGLDFYRRVVELQKEYGRSGQVVSNSLQTNGMLLDDEWCRFLLEYKWLLGISIDGPRELHDHYRKDSAGGGTFDEVMEGVEACRRNRVQFNVLTLITNSNCGAVDELFDFYAREEFKFVQLIPCVEKDRNGVIAEYSVGPEQLGEFWCEFFDRWLANGPQKMSVRLFD